MYAPIHFLSIWLIAGLSPGARPNMASLAVNQGCSFSCSISVPHQHQLQHEQPSLTQCRVGEPFEVTDGLNRGPATEYRPALDEISKAFLAISTRSQENGDFCPSRTDVHSTPSGPQIKDRPICSVRPRQGAPSAPQTRVNSHFLEFSSRCFRSGSKSTSNTCAVVPPSPLITTGVCDSDVSSSVPADAYAVARG